MKVVITVDKKLGQTSTYYYFFIFSRPAEGALTSTGAEAGVFECALLKIKKSKMWRYDGVFLIYYEKIVGFNTLLIQVLEFSLSVI